MSRSLVAALATLLVATGPALAASVDHALAYDELNDVTYYFAQGDLASASLVNQGDATGPLPIDFDGCLFAQMRPEKGLGRVQVIGLVDNQTYVEVEFDEFVSPDGFTPAIMPNLTLDASYGQTPAVRTSMAVWGTAVLVVDNEPLLEPVGGGDRVDASLFVGRDGVRGDDGNLTAVAQRGDDELHLRLRTPEGTSAETVRGAFAPAGDLPNGQFSPNEAYSDRFFLQNVKFGGTARVVVSSSANAPDGMNDFTVTAHSPTGKSLAEVRLTPALLQDDVQEFVFPLSEFGVYSLDVRGAVGLMSYTLDVTLEPAPALDLDFWWETLHVGEEAQKAMTDCRKQMGYAVVPGTVVGRDDPPSFLLELVIVGVIAGIGTALLIVRIVSDSATESLFRKQVGK